MRILLLALLAFASIVQADDVADREKAERNRAERRALLGRALLANARASDLAMQARREPTADNRDRVLDFLRSAFDLEYEISSKRALFRAPTDILVQPVQRYRPDSTILRQAARVGQGAQ